MADGVPLCVSRYAFTALEVFGIIIKLKNETMANQLLSIWYSMVDQNHNSILTRFPTQLAEIQPQNQDTLTSPLCFTDVCRHSVAHLP